MLLLQNSFIYLEEFSTRIFKSGFHMIAKGYSLKTVFSDSNDHIYGNVQSTDLAAEQLQSHVRSGILIPFTAIA